MSVNAHIIGAMEESSLIGEGRTAEILAWTPGKVLKLYRDWWPLANIEYEVRIARIVHESGVACPAPGDLIQYEGRYGLIYERVDGLSMDRLLLAELDRGQEVALVLARLHTAMHKPVAADLPSQRHKLMRAIERVPTSVLPEPLRNKALDAMQPLPDGNILCHGDFHPGNVLLAESGPMIIDWENASLGNPLADVARTALLLETAHLYLEKGKEAVGLQDSIRSFREAYLQEYARITGVSLADIEVWRLPVAAARLSEEIEMEEEYLVGLVRNA